jgi:hypothetical protein
MSMSVIASLLLFAAQASDGKPAPQNPAPTPQAEAKARPAPAGPIAFEVAGNKIAIYGILRMDLYYGTARFNHEQFTYYALSPDPSQTATVNEEHNWIDITPRLSRFGIKVDRETLPFWGSAKASGVLEFDFQNRATSEVSGLESESRELPRLRHAYVKITSGGFSILGGQTWDLISPLWPAANADGMMWNSGNLGDRRPQVRAGWETLIGEEAGFNAAVAIARTGAIDRKNLDGAADSMRDGDDSARPMLQGRIGLSTLAGKRIDLGVWGHYGWERTETRIAGRSHFYTTSVGADLKVKICDELVFAGEIWHGKNLSDLRGGIDQGVDVTSGREIIARGGWAELVAQLTAPYSVAVGVGVDDVNHGSLSLATQRDHNIAPYIWNRVDFGGGITVGAEAIFWATDYVNLETGRANRYSLFMTYAF